MAVFLVGTLTVSSFFEESIFEPEIDFAQLNLASTLSFLELEAEKKILGYLKNPHNSVKPPLAPSPTQKKRPYTLRGLSYKHFG